MHSPDLAEYIGGESCFILKADVADIPTLPAKKNHRRSRVAAAEAEKEYPPPLDRLPSVMRKYSTGDGRVVIKEEKVKRHQYLRAHRSDGRLLLKLQVEEFDVCPENMDGEDDVDPTVEEEEEEEVGSRECYNIYNESGVNNPCGGFAAVAAFGPPVLT